MGVILYIMLSGKYPFHGKSDEETAMKIKNLELTYDDKF